MKTEPGSNSELFVLGDKVRIRCQYGHDQVVTHNARVVVPHEYAPVLAYLEVDGPMCERVLQAGIDFVAHDPDWDPFGELYQTDEPQICRHFLPSPQFLVWVRAADPADARQPSLWYPAEVETQETSWRFVRALDGVHMWHTQVQGVFPVIGNW